MKHSIRKIFTNLSIYLLFVLLIASISILLVMEQNLSIKKIDNLNKQKLVILNLTKLPKQDIERTLIEFNSKSTQLLTETQNLHNLYKYNFTEQYILKNSAEYLADLNLLTKLTKDFNTKANEYYIKYTKKELLKNKKKVNKQHFRKAFYLLNKHIDSLILKNMSYSNEKFFLIEKMVLFSFILILLMTLWFKNRLRLIYADILFLYSIRKNRENYAIFSEEMDAISLRMKKKTVVAENPALIDQVTGVYNHKGMISSYETKKGMKNSNFITVTVFEIDNFSKSNRAFSQELTQLILKKVAFTISLHEQPTDVIARTDYNQFTVILSRQSKEQSYKDIDIIRQSIGELKFNVPNKGTVNITASGGFIIKPNTLHIEETLRNAKAVLKYARENGGNRVTQERDLNN